MPVFAIVFLALALINIDGLVPAGCGRPWARSPRWGLLVAIAALGLGTSVTAILRVGWRHVAVVCGTTAVILGAVIAGLLILL